MSKIGYNIPKFIKNPILYIINGLGRLKGKIYVAASHGKIWFPDKAFMNWDYKIRNGRKINFKNPVGYSDKMSWMKYYYRRPEFWKYVDKIKVRDFVKEKIGEEYLIKLYGTYNKFDDIDFSTLPDKFVLKCSHDSGSTIICKDKNTFDFKKAKEKLTYNLSINKFYTCREWPYKNVKPMILAEELLEDTELNKIIDYKISCFNGEPKHLTVLNGMSESGLQYCDYVDLNFDIIPVKEKSKPVNPNFNIKKPQNFDKMIEFARTLSQGFPYIRVDFFNISGKIYFGEMTFYNNGGRDPYVPDYYENLFGSWVTLPQITR